MFLGLHVHKHCTCYKAIKTIIVVSYSIPDDSAKYTLMINLSTDGAETESLHTDSSELCVLTKHQPNVCTQPLASGSSLTVTYWIK